MDDSRLVEEGKPEDSSIADLFTRLVDDTDDFVRAEVRLFRAQAMRRVALSRGALILTVAGLLIVQAVTVALLVGLILALAPVIGPLLATIAILGIALIIAGLLLRSGWKRLQIANYVEEPRP